MKVAICISGICRGQAKRNVDLARLHFPTAEFFFSTWEGQPKLPFENAFYHPEPKMHYHPVVDLVDDNCKAPKWLAYKHILCKEKAVYERTSHQSKQILGHALLLQEVPKEYDMIMRMRYDTVLSKSVDFTPLLERSYKENLAIGFGTRDRRHKDLNSFAEVPQIYPTKDSPPGTSHDWGWYLMDPLIMHPRKMFDIELVFRLHEEKKLYPSERGWYQILSAPFGDNHVSMYGGVQIEKYLKGKNINI